MKEIDEIRQRAEKATDAPWRRGIGEDCEKVFSVQKDIVARCGPSNGWFIAHARQDIPHLCDALDFTLGIIKEFGVPRATHITVAKITNILKGE